MPQTQRAKISKREMLQFDAKKNIYLHKKRTINFFYLYGGMCQPRLLNLTQKKAKRDFKQSDEMNKKAEEKPTSIFFSFLCICLINFTRCPDLKYSSRRFGRFRTLFDILAGLNVKNRTCRDNRSYRSLQRNRDQYPRRDNSVRR